MSVKVMALVWDHYPEGGSELLLALALADWANHDGSGIYPSVAQMADKVHMAERSVQYLLGKMKARGWLIQVNPGGIVGGRKLATNYRIPVDLIPLGFVGRVQTLHPSVSVDNLPTWVQSDALDGCNLTQERVQPVAPQPSVTINKPPKGPEAPFQLPDWVPVEHWNAWLEVRTKKKVPNTTRALQIALCKLQALKEQGYPPDKVLDNAIEKGWRGIYTPTELSTGQNSQPRWWESDSAMQAMAKQHGVSTLGKTRYQLKAAIEEKMSQQGRPH